MKVQTGYIYHIKDSFFEKVNDSFDRVNGSFWIFHQGIGLSRIICQEQRLPTAIVG